MNAVMHFQHHGFQPGDLHGLILAGVVFAFGFIVAGFHRITHV
jgi:hypothetical protein